MADYSQLFSIRISINPEATGWLQEKLGATLERHREADSDILYDHYAFDSRIDTGDNTLSLCSDSESSPAAAASFLHRYLRKFDPAGVVLFQYANICNRPLLDAFGGGAIRVSSEDIEFVTSCNAIREWEKATERCVNASV